MCIRDRIKSPEQQATLMLHKTRELLVKQRTMSVNALRGHLSEFGIVAAKGIGRVDELLDLAESDATLPNAARASVKVLAQALEGLDKAIDDLEKEISSAHAQNEMSQLLDKVCLLYTSATEDQEQPAKKHERKLASMIGIPVVGLVWGLSLIHI